MKTQGPPLSAVESLGRRDLWPAPDPMEPKVAYVFSPYGQQWVGMGRSMFQEEPAFRAALRRCDEGLRRHTGWSLIDELFLDEPSARLDDVGVTQPLVFAIQVGIAAWLESVGVRPAAVTGHSLGEIAACVVSGMLDLADACRLVCHYSDQQRRVVGPREGMAVVGLSAADAAGHLDNVGGRVCISAVNGPRTTALSGARDELESIVAELIKRDIPSAMIRVDLAAHSPTIDLVMDDLVRLVGQLSPAPPRIPMVSSVTGSILTPAEITADYFARNLRFPVRLADTIDQLLRDEFTILTEISAHPVLVPALWQSIGDHGGSAHVVTTMRRSEDDRLPMLEAAETLAKLGVQLG